MAEINTVFSHETLMKAYEQMLLIRRFEEKAGQLYGMGLIGGFCHLYIGQEAVVAGIGACLDKDDAVITSYRDHAHMIAAGTDPKVIMAELLGRIGGCSKGKGGSMHMFDLENQFYGGHGIVAAQVPIGTGIAFANKYKKNKNICVTYMGDGAAHQGQVYESFNMASLWELPVLYIIENNEYAMGTSVSRSSSTPNLHMRAESYGIKNIQVNGMNILEVIKHAKEAVDYIRETSKPVVIEMKTYRFRGHSMSDPGKYRQKEELEKYKQIDPIIHLKDFIKKEYKIDDDIFETLEKKIKNQVTEIVEFAKNSPEPGVEELYTDVYY